MEIVHRYPTTEKFAAITRAVGFKPHPPEAIRIGLAHSWSAVCALIDDTVVGVGRIIGDEALHFYITGVMVAPTHQRQGIGSRIVEALLAEVKKVPYSNALVEALPLPGLERCYGRFGFKASRRYAPGMHLWLNSNGA